MPVFPSQAWASGTAMMEETVDTGETTEISGESSSAGTVMNSLASPSNTEVEKNSSGKATASDAEYDEDGFLLDGRIQDDIPPVAGQDTAVMEPVSEAFEESCSIDDVTITLSSPEGVFPEGAELSVRKITEESELQDIEDIVSPERPENITVLRSLNYDIKVLLDGEEIQPDTDHGKVRVSFTLENEDLSKKHAAVYHIQDEDGKEKNAESLDVEVETLTEASEPTDDGALLLQQRLLLGKGDKNQGTMDKYVISVETDSFSKYQMILFQYGAYEYTLNEESVLVSDVLAFFGLDGTVSNVTVNDTTVFSVTRTSDGSDWEFRVIDEYNIASWKDYWLDVVLDGETIRISLRLVGVYIYWGINGDGELRISTRQLPVDEYSGGKISNYSGDEYSSGGITSDINKASEVKRVVVGEEGLPVKTNNLVGWFQDFINVESMDLRYLDTSEVQWMALVFKNCASLETLDLSTWDTRAVLSMKEMFRGCSSLETILVGGNWSTDALQFGADDMFTGAVSLKGGAGTVYDSSHTDAAYAHIDNGTADPGYFTSGDPALIHVDGVSLNKRALSLKTGDEETLTATITPEYAQNRNVSWDSSNDAVAAVDQNGKVTAVGPGTAVIKVTTEEGAFTASCTVTVTQPVTGVRLDKSNLILQEGEDYAFTVTVLPENATNQKVRHLQNEMQPLSFRTESVVG